MSGRPLPTTDRGRATRDRIVAAAAELMYAGGVAGTSLDDVREATGTSKSQLYHYFAAKSDLVCAVIAYQQNAVLAGQQPFLGDFSSLAGLESWRDQVVAMNGAELVFGGCPIGGLASETADADELARKMAAAAFGAWSSQLAAGLRRMQVAGELAADADPADLAMGLLAALQGGLLLTQATQEIRPLEVALDHALSAVRAQAKAAP